MIEIREEDFSIDEVVERMRNPKIGAIVSYLGTVRESSLNKKEVERLEFNYSKDMRKQLEKIEKRIIAQFDIEDTVIIHRVGSLSVAEHILLILVSAAHRKQAFDACSYLIDGIKDLHRSWKKEVLR